MKEPVTPQDILQIQKDRTGKPVPNGKWFYKGRELTKGEVDNLKAEAELIAKTALWKILVNEGKYHAQKRAIEAKDLKDLRQVQEYHKVVVLFEGIINNIGK